MKVCKNCSIEKPTLGEDQDRMLSALAYLMSTRDMLGAVTF